MRNGEDDKIFTFPIYEDLWSSIGWPNIFRIRISLSGTFFIRDYCIEVCNIFGMGGVDRYGGAQGILVEVSKIATDGFKMAK